MSNTCKRVSMMKIIQNHFSHYPELQYLTERLICTEWISPSRKKSIEKKLNANESLTHENSLPCCPSNINKKHTEYEDKIERNEDFVREDENETEMFFEQVCLDNTAIPANAFDSSVVGTHTRVGSATAGTIRLGDSRDLGHLTVGSMKFNPSLQKWENMETDEKENESEVDEMACFSDTDEEEPGFDTPESSNDHKRSSNRTMNGNIVDISKNRKRSPLPLLTAEDYSSMCASETFSKSVSARDMNLNVRTPFSLQSICHHMGISSSL